MMKDKLRAEPRRYRPTWRTRIHYLIWSLIILALWPVGRLLEKCGRMRRYY